MPPASIDVSETINEYLSRSDWRVHANANQDFSLGGLMLNTNGKVVANYWLNEVFHSEAGQAHRNGDIHIHDLDMLSGYCAGWSLRENLPFFDEPASPKSGNPYQHDHTKRWAAKIADYDGFVFVFPEYNGSYPAVLKNAVDYLYPEWKNKPVSYVSYGFGAGKRAAAAFTALAENVDLQLIEQVSLPTDCAGLSLSIT